MIPGTDLSFASLVDISALQRSREKVKFSEARFRQLIDSARDFIVTTDQQGVVTSVNKALLDWGEITRDEIVGHNVMEFVAPESLDTVKEHVRKRAQGEIAVFSYEFTIRSPKGKTMVVEQISTPLKLGDAEPEVLIIQRDLTSRRRLEKIERERQALLEVQKLARTVAHEFRQPLTALQLIASMGESDETVQKRPNPAFGRISNAVERINQLVTQLLDVTELKSVPYVFDMDILDLNGSEGKSKKESE